MKPPEDLVLQHRLSCLATSMQQLEAGSSRYVLWDIQPQGAEEPTALYPHVITHSADIAT